MKYCEGSTTRPALPKILRGAAFFLMAGIGILYSQTTISLPADFPPKAIIFQQYNADTGKFLPLRFAGNQTVGPNGDITSTGPLYTSQTDFFPNAMLDTARNLFFLNPGTFGTVKNGAVVSVGVPTAGTYDVSGMFARANDALNAGDGVRVVAFVNNQIGTPVFDAVISSHNFVNPNNPFSGTGVAPFHFTAALAQGDTVQFAVFSGTSLLDGTFDFTALQFTISGGGTTISLPSDFPPRPILFQQYNADSGTFLPLRFAGSQTVGPNGDITSTGPLYTSQTDFFPYAVLDTARNLFFFHPGTFGTAKNGAVVSVGVPTAGTYDVSGSFARANDALNAGDGVRVVAFVNNQIAAPLFDGAISSNNPVNPNDPFSGAGVVPFHFTAALAQGDTVQFAVFSGPSFLDGTFDFTALQFTITPPGTQPCTYSPSPTGQSFSPQGGVGSFIVNTYSTCVWSTVPGASWIKVLSSATKGIGQVVYSVAPNNGPPRTGAITVGGQTFSINQSGFSCSNSIGPTFASPDDTGGNISVSVSALAGCSWTATSNVAWVTVKSGASGSGGGVVVLNVATNSGGPRSGTATIAGQTFSVNQGAGACGAVDVTALVAVTRSGLTPGQFGYYWFQSITVRNTSASPIPGPIYLVFLGVPNHRPSPYGDSLNFNTLTTCFSSQGDSDLLILPGGLQPGQTVPLSVTFFTDSIAASIQYTPKVLSGPPSH